MIDSPISLDFLKAIANKHDVSKAELEVLLSALDGQTSVTIAEMLGISQVAVRKRLGEVYRKFDIGGTGPGKLIELKQRLLEFQQSADTKPTKQRDWGNAEQIDFFYGREEELAQLEEWILTDRCRLIAILGMGGIGKTSLVLKLAEQIQDQFDFVIWRSLYTPKPLEELLEDLIRVLSSKQEKSLPANVDDRITLLTDYLRRYRCLLILDNAETILSSNDLAGRYSKGSEKYGELLKRIGTPRIGEVPHQSCLLLTSREKPKGIAELEGEKLPVRSRQLLGLSENEAKKILEVKGLHGSEENKRKLVIRYIRNPLAIKIAATTIKELFNGNIDDFLEESSIVFGDIRSLIKGQFDRLSNLEKKVMYWLAIGRNEQVSLPALRRDILIPISQIELQEALQSLAQRSLIETSSGLFRLQSVIMTYVTNQLIDQICREIVDLNILDLAITVDASKPAREIATHLEQAFSIRPLFCSHSLIKAQTKDYVRQDQIDCILRPVVGRLIIELGSKEKVEEQLQRAIEKIRNQPPLAVGYAGGNIINLIRYLESEASKPDWSKYNLSNLNIRQAYLQDINLHNANFSCSNIIKSVFSETFGNILSIAFSPTGSILALGDTNDEIHLWSLTEVEQMDTCKGHLDWVRAVTFSPDGQLLASASDDQTIRLWNVATRQCVGILQGHTSSVRAVAFSPDGQTLASGSSDNTVRIWHPGTGESRVLEAHTNSVRAVAFSPDGSLLASASGDSTVKLWDTHTYRCLQTLQEHQKAVRAVTFAPSSGCDSINGQLLASASSDQTVKLWSVHHKSATSVKDLLDERPIEVECIHTLEKHTNRVRSVAFSSDSKILASSGDDQTVMLWDAQTGENLSVLADHTSRVWSVAFSPIGRVVASGSDDRTARLWDVDANQYSQILRGYTMQVWSVAFSPNGQQVASGNDDQTVRLWDIATGDYETLPGHTSRVWSVAFSPDGQLLASGSDDQTVRLWDVNTRQCIQIIQERIDCVRAVCFSPNQQALVLATGSDDNLVRLWDVNTRQLLRTLEGHEDRVLSIAFSPDGQTLASSSSDQTIKLWKIVSGKCIKTLDESSDWVRSAIFSPDGTVLASASRDQTIKLWKVNTGECYAILQGHGGRVRSITFSPDGRTLVSGSDDQSVQLWDVQSASKIGTCLEHDDWVRTVAFSPDGATFVSGSKDETIKLWQVGHKDSVKTLRARRPYENMNIFGVTGLTDTQKVTLKSLGAVEKEPLIKD